MLCRLLPVTASLAVMARGYALALCLACAVTLATAQISVPDAVNTVTNGVVNHFLPQPVQTPPPINGPATPAPTPAPSTAGAPPPAWTAGYVIFCQQVTPAGRCCAQAAHARELLNTAPSGCQVQT